MNNTTTVTDVQMFIRKADAQKKQAAVRTRRFEERIWGKLPKLYLPSLMVDKRNDTLTLDNYALSVLVALLSIQRNQTLRHKMNPFSEPEYGSAALTADRETLMRITGMSKNLITKGIQSLEKAGYVAKYAQRVPQSVYARTNELDRHQQFAASRFTFLNPTTGQPLTTGSEQGLLFGNGLHYFAIPACMVERHPKTAPATYAFSDMNASEKRLYIVLAWLANQFAASEFNTTGQRLKSLTRLSNLMLKKAFDGLESRYLVLDTASDPTIRHIHIVMRNPRTRELLGVQTFDSNPRNNACNYYEPSGEGKAPRANLQMSAEQAESLFLQMLDERGETATREARGEFKFSCPFHDDSKPSCNFNPRLGCFRCFSGSCMAKGTTLALLKQLSGETGEATIQRVAAMLNKPLEYREPDWVAIAIYDYRDRLGNLRKQVLRLKDDADGNRRFSQRRLSKEGWVYVTKGMRPMLFNLPEIQSADTVFVCEGEKDAVTITNLGLIGRSSKAIGTTSGNADSWEPRLARELEGKGVIILPDDDEAGERYCHAVEESLLAVGVTPRIVRFTGTGAKDVTDYMNAHSIEDLVRLIGVNWIRMPDGSQLDDPSSEGDPGPIRRDECVYVDVDLSI